MDEDDEEEMAMETGEPEPQEDVTPTERLWVGGIPSNLVGGDQALSSVLNINANRNITSLFSQFGKVKHSTVRVKAGENKSWALITFEDIASAKACYEEGITVLDAKYEEIKLRVSYGKFKTRACRLASHGASLC
jgi:RNA recognition motif-containing protein|eukprot:COSAG06_NODE_3662_length_5052_cov_16.029667_5_plen_135_part_00